MSSQHSGGALVVQKPNRRTFLQTTAGTLAFGWNAIPAATQASTTAADKAPAFPPNQTAPVLASNEGKKPLRLGLIIAIGRDPGAAIAKVRDLGLVSCQVFVSDFDPKMPRLFAGRSTRIRSKPLLWLSAGRAAKSGISTTARSPSASFPATPAPHASRTSKKLPTSPSNAAFLPCKRTAALSRKTPTIRFTKKS